MSNERLYVVQWSDDGTSWWVVWDNIEGSKVPAAFETVTEAERRRSAMADQFEDASYRVVGYEWADADC